MHRTTRLLTVLAVAGTVAIPASASAATRYAAPAGAPDASCATPATACSLTTAINGVAGNMTANGDEVVVGAGDYPVTDGLTGGGAFLSSIHGAAGGSRPRLQLSGSSFLNASGARLGDLEITSTSSNTPLTASGTLVERVVVRGNPQSAGSPVCQCNPTLVRDSVFVSTGAGPALGVVSNGGSGSPTYRNVTAYASVGGTPALMARQLAASGTVAITAVNVLARNGAGGPDVVAMGHDATVTLRRSAYATSDATGKGAAVADAPKSGHVTAAPLFTDAAAFDLRPTAASPTVDAGLDDPLNGTTDADGLTRTAGAATDIGAHELQPPVPVVDPDPTPTATPVLSGTPAPAATPRPDLRPVRDTTPPTVGPLRVSRRSLALKGPKARRSLTLRFTMDEPAVVAVTVTRLGKHGRRIGVLRKPRSAGTPTMVVTGTVAGHRLKPGRYRLVVSVTDAGANASVPRAIVIRVTRGRGRMGS